MVANSPSYRHAYVHVPFCARRCSYCDFSIAVRRDVPSALFANGIAQELSNRRIEAGSLALDSLYFGGGTPSRLGAVGVSMLLDVMQTVATLAPEAEVTLEANPEDITVEAVRAWRAAGVNRLSIGVQSFDDRVLQWMHRVHTAADARRAIEMARDGGLEAFSLDLIFSVPEALSRDWSRDLDTMLSIAPDHISLYGLTIEPHTPLGRWQARGEVTEGSEERYELEFLDAHARLASAGYEHYEVSNFARPGHRARHNSAYWRGVPYLGLGPSAHGFDGNARRWNESAYAAWQVQVGTGIDPMAGTEVLSEANHHAEAIYLGLRTSDGITLSAPILAAVQPWFDAGWLEWAPIGSPMRARCTPLGWLRLDRLAADLTALPSHS